VLREIEIVNDIGKAAERKVTIQSLFVMSADRRILPNEHDRTLEGRKENQTESSSLSFVMRDRLF